MKSVIDRAGSRGYADHGWLKTYHTFSFADYYNPQRIQFGKLRVLNDDEVDPQEGFDMHQHRNMEVISIPLAGYLRHGDSIKNTKVIFPGFIQVMSSGTGIYHSEYNDSTGETLKFLQIWVFPREENTRPAYNNYDIRPLLKENQLSLIVSPDGSTPASILQDAWFSMGTIDAGQKTGYKMYGKGTGVYLFMIGGEVKIGDITLGERDGAGFYETDRILIETQKKSTILLIEVPMGNQK